MMPVHVAAIIHFYAIISREEAGMYILIGVGVLITFYGRRSSHEGK